VGRLGEVKVKTGTRDRSSEETTLKILEIEHRPEV
jgi:hypothetical protein